MELELLKHPQLSTMHDKHPSQDEKGMSQV